MSWASEGSSEPTTAGLLKREIPWDTYLTARLISDKDLQLIRRYDKRERNNQREQLRQHGTPIVEAFLSVLRTVTKEETVQYALAVLDDMVTDDPSSAKYFHSSGGYSSHQPNPYEILLRLLQKTDWFTLEKAARLLTAVLETRPNKSIVANGHAPSTSSAAADPADDQAADLAVQPIMSGFIEWLCNQLRRPAHPSRSVPVAVSSLSKLLRERPARALAQRQGILQLLSAILRSGAGMGHQLQYETGLCVWQLTYLPQAKQAMGAAGLVPGLVDTVRTASKEKVLRVALMALKSLLADSKLELGPEMVEAGLPRYIAQRQQQNWEDEDVKAALEEIGKGLADNIQLLSSWDKYRKEVLNANLEWTPMHTSTAFWKENAGKLADNSCQLLKVLLNLLKTGREEKTLAVGCNDVGEFVLHHPDGRAIVSDMKGKEYVMKLMHHPDAEVQKQALLCVQKLMLAKDKLQFLGIEVAAGDF